MFTGLLRNRGPVSIRRLCSATTSVVPGIAKVAANPYSVPLEYAGSRADKFLATRLAIPFSLAQKLLRTGQVRLQKEASKSRIDGAYKLAAGDVLLLPPSAAVNAPQQKQKVVCS
jgi:23S rRNA-/tRNA-specific pseudouridylate synthase